LLLNDEQQALAKPTKTLRAIFRNEAHPRADLVDYVPTEWRRDFLLGLIYGIAEEPVPEDA
jgi:hypothetical protein